VKEVIKVKHTKHQNKKLRQKDRWKKRKVGVRIQYEGVRGFLQKSVTTESFGPTLILLGLARANSKEQQLRCDLRHPVVIRPFDSIPRQFV
jgi:hypothetical protein